MMETVSQGRATRSPDMGRIRSKDTQPELVVRRILRSLGYGYRIHCKDLPGTPDIVFLGKRKVIFVHGCFWHHHLGCKRATLPKSNQDYWLNKLSRNMRRDKTIELCLQRMGWQVLVVWECETKQPNSLREALSTFLGMGVAR